jgi:hypothetical protein
MRRIDYDQKDKNTGNTENLIAVDQPVEKEFGNMQRAYEEGFAASDGVRGETAETNGRVKHPEKGDASSTRHAEGGIDDENPGLADN